MKTNLWLPLLLFLYAGYLLIYTQGIGVRSYDIVHHYYVVESIANLDFFPDANARNFSEHGVSPYLPVYHGIIGAHLLAAVLYKVGLPLPLAVKAVWELSFIFTFILLVWFIMRINTPDDFPKPVERRIRLALLIGLAGFAVFELFMVSAYLGFYSQAAAIPFVLWGFKKWLENERKRSYLLLGFALLIYPEFALFAFPAVALVEKNWVIKGMAALIWAGLFLVFLKRMPLTGAADYDLSATIVLMAVLLILGLRGRVKATPIFLLSCFFLIETVLAASVALLNSNFPNYYLVKHQMWAWILLVLLLAQVKMTTRMALAIYLLGMMYLSHVFIAGNYNNYLAFFKAQKTDSAYLPASSWNSLATLKKELENAKRDSRTIAYLSHNYQADGWSYLLGYFRAYEFLSLLPKSEFLNTQILQGQLIMDLRNHRGPFTWFSTDGLLNCDKTFKLVTQYKEEVFILRSASFAKCTVIPEGLKVIRTSDFIAVFAEESFISGK